MKWHWSQTFKHWAAVDQLSPSGTDSSRTCARLYSRDFVLYKYLLLISDIRKGNLRMSIICQPSCWAIGTLFSQALMRKLQNIGLQVAYREDSNVNWFLQRTAALAFVPVRFVRLAWQAIKVAAQQLPRIQEFIRYFEDTWLVGNYPSIISIPKWLLQNQQPPWTTAGLGRHTQTSMNLCKLSRKNRQWLKCLCSSWKREHTLPEEP